MHEWDVPRFSYQHDRLRSGTFCPPLNRWCSLQFIGNTCMCKDAYKWWLQYQAMFFLYFACDKGSRYIHEIISKLHNKITSLNHKEKMVFNGTKRNEKDSSYRGFRNIEVNYTEVRLYVLPSVSNSYSQVCSGFQSFFFFSKSYHIQPIFSWSSFLQASGFMQKIWTDTNMLSIILHPPSASWDNFYQGILPIISGQ